MTAPAGHPLAYKDAIFLSPHKFIGGPSTPGVLVARRELFTNRVPVVPGGGTVAYVNPEDHAYLADPAHREEGGTPAIIEAVRAGLVFQLKEAVGVETIRAHEERLLARAVEAWRAEPSIEILGNLDAPRLSIVSFVVRAPSGHWLHHNFVVALLNDLFGVQSRGGCSCAGPYGHRLLGIDLERSHEFEREITGGCEGIKPGWVRVNFNYFLSDTVADYVVDAVRLVARDGWRLLGDYLFDPLTGRWRHRDGLVEPPIRLGDVGYADDGSMVVPRSDARGGEELLAAAPARRGRDPRRGGAARPRVAPGRRVRRLRAPALVRPAGERDRPMTAAAPGPDPSSAGGALPIGDPVPGWSARPWPPGVTLVGRTAVLEALGSGHVDDLTAAWAGTDEGHWAYLPMERPEGRDGGGRARLGRWSTTRSWVSYAVLVGGRAAGVLSLMRVDPANGSIEIGAVIFGSPLVRTVASTEAQRLLMGHVFDDLGYRRLEWKCNALNAPSRAAALRLGYSFEGVFRQAMVVKGRNRDTAWFSVVDGEWPAVRARLDAWLDPSNFDAAGGQRRRLGG